MRQFSKKLRNIIPSQIKKPFNFIYSSILEIDEPRRLKKFYSQFLKKGDLVFDIGANKGLHTKIFLDLDCRVVAVEPNPELVNKLNNKFGKKIVLVDKGIGPKNDVMDFKMFLEDGHSTFYKNNPKLVNQYLYKTIPLQVITLNNLIEQYGKPSFIKIDVEGFEYNVLKTLKFPTTVVFEFTSSIFDVAIKCIEHLNKIGNAKFNYTYSINHKLELNKWVSGEELVNLLKKSTPHLFGDIVVRFKK